MPVMHLMVTALTLTYYNTISRAKTNLIVPSKEKPYVHQIVPNIVLVKQHMFVRLFKINNCNKTYFLIKQSYFVVNILGFCI